MSVDISGLNERIKEESSFVSEMKSEMGKVIVGQSKMVDRLLIGLLTKGHILLEGVPGLAKTLSISTLAKIVDTDFKRIQFTPDLLPADILGTMVYNQKTGEFVPKKGPLFSNIILADEINRAPAKVQSALLEAMQERQVTIGDETYALKEPFLVLATQNPIEQEGTYPLPEAQVDRFMLKLRIVYPTKEEEKEILSRMSTGPVPEAQKIVTVDKLLASRELVNEIYMDPRVEEYIVNIVYASREPAQCQLDDLKELIAYGASPRATLFLCRAARAHAFIRGRGYVTPEDVKSIGMDVLRHRVLVTYEAEAENITSEQIVQKIFDSVEVP
ncbi:AAA family ATPase [Chitinispirillales bacterium ANBcel5]|uniref:AAA family ATPase n=1 Tax=Cellulosispirillum alkaliphilum TaxID=3039283 RepID=UPI002A501727|nr:AAA family ATPase [Chitinispirillales bacterium ANBcel5]